MNIAFLFFVLIRAFSLFSPYYVLLSISGYLSIVGGTVTIAIPSILTLMAPLIATRFQIHVPKNILENAVLPAIVEEVAFRECIYPSWLAAILFGMMHLKPGITLPIAVDTMLSCVLFHYWMVRIRPANIVAHFWWNLIVLNSATDDENTALNTIEIKHSTMLLLLILAFIG